MRFSRFPRFPCRFALSAPPPASALALALALTAVGVIGASLAALVGTACAAHAQLVPGDVLLDNGNGVQRYNAAGTLVRTYSGTGTNYEGASITPDGNIVSTYRGTGSGKGGIVIYRPNGTLLKTFTIPAVSFPGDVSVFADGTLAISDQNSGAAGAAPAIREYSQAGTLLRSITGFGMNNPFGNTVAPDNTLFLADSGINTIFHFTETGTLLNSFVVTFGPTDLVVHPTDGTLFISDITGNVVHTTATGTVLGSFASGVSSDFDGIGLSGDGNYVFAAGAASTTIRKLDSTTGALVSSIPITRSAFPLFLTVVPNAVGPEPATLPLLGMGLTLGAGLLLRSRKMVATVQRRKPNKQAV